MQLHAIYPFQIYIEYDYSKCTVRYLVSPVPHSLLKQTLRLTLSLKNFNRAKTRQCDIATVPLPLVLYGLILIVINW